MRARACLGLVALCFIGFPVGTAVAQPPAGAMGTGTGLNSAALARLLKRAKESNSDSVVIYKDGRIVGQWYFGKPEGPIEMMSATKSIVNLAIGRLVLTGKIKSIDQPVHEFFPEWKQGRKQKITIRHLLNHTSGLQNDPNTGVEIYPSPNFVRLALAAELTADPGTAFSYNNKAVNLLAGIVKVASGKPMDEYIRKEIFTPLGITKSFWMQDQAGNPHAMSGVQLRAVDVIKIGRLMLDRGAWKGRQIVSREWVAESTRAGQPYQPNCGLLWWREGKFPRLAADDELIAKWRKGGASEAFIKRMMPFKGKTYATRTEFLAALEKGLGKEGMEIWNANTWQRDLMTSKTLPGEADGFSALGYLGQYLVVFPAHRLIAVRQMRAPESEDVDPDSLDSFVEFADMVRALVEP